MPRIVLFCACCDAGEHHGWSVLAVLPDTMDIEPEHLATEVARRSGWVLETYKHRRTITISNSTRRGNLFAMHFKLPWHNYQLLGKLLFIPNSSGRLTTAGQQAQKLADLKKRWFYAPVSSAAYLTKWCLFDGTFSLTPLGAGVLQEVLHSTDDPQNIKISVYVLFTSCGYLFVWVCMEDSITGKRRPATAEILFDSYIARRPPKLQSYKDGRVKLL